MLVYIHLSFIMLLYDWFSKHQQDLTLQPKQLGTPELDPVEGLTRVEQRSRILNLNLLAVLLGMSPGHSWLLGCERTSLCCVERLHAHYI